MNIFLKIKEVFKGEKAAPIAFQTSGALNKRDDRDFYRYALEGYQRNPIVYKCIHLISKNIASLPLIVVDKDGEKIPNHPIQNILSNPNPVQGGQEFIEELVTDKLIGGNAFTVRSKSEEDGKILELWVLRPDSIQIVVGRTIIPLRFEHVIGGSIVDVYEVDQATGMSDCKHFKDYNPLDRIEGMSALKPAEMVIDISSAIDEHNKSLLDNDLNPGGYLKYTPTDSTGRPAKLTPDQSKQIRKDLDKMHSGVKNAGKIMILEGGFTFESPNMTPRDMSFDSLSSEVNAKIALALGVPDQLVGIQGAQTYANVKEARQSFYYDTIKPQAERIASDLNEWFREALDDNRIEFDFDSAPIISDMKREKEQSLSQMISSGIYTINEAREILDLNPIENGGDVYLPSNLFPVGSNSIPDGDETVSEVESLEAYGDADT